MKQNEEWIQAIEHCRSLLEGFAPSSKEGQIFRSLRSLENYLEEERRLPGYIADALVGTMDFKEREKAVSDEINALKAMCG